jgi:hypothetical protein
MNRRALIVVVGLSLIGLAERLVSRVQNPSTGLPHVDAPHFTLGGRPGECLTEPVMLAAIAAEGWVARPETPTFCAQPAGLQGWLVVSNGSAVPTHLAFDAKGCLADWAPCD